MNSPLSKNRCPPFTIQLLDKQLSAILKQQAQAEQKSVNKFVLETHKKRVGLGKEKRFTREDDDLDNLFDISTISIGELFSSFKSGNRLTNFRTF